MGGVRHRDGASSISGASVKCLFTMSSDEKIIRGTARADEIRDVSISYILGRSEVMPDLSLMRRRVNGRTVLIPSGGEAIGSELCRQIVKPNPIGLIVLDNQEVNLY